jgi:alpha-glucoside transport system substrate-binding protein
MHKRAVAATAVLGASVLALAACGGSSGGGGGGASSPPTGGAKLTGACAQYNQYAGAKGTVTIFGSIISPESNSLAKSWAQFEQCTGITINYTGSNTFESDLPVKVNGGNPPDLALIPQPGLLTQMVEAGAVKKPPAQTVANEANWSQYWKNYGSVGGTFFAAPMSANMKSLVWYSPKFFKAHGYQVPTTWAALMSLSAKIAKSGNTKPWCGGINSGTASGWPATDWLEEVVLGKYGAQVYADWISHKVKFDSPQILAAMTIVHNWMQNPAWVNGGYGGV